MAMIGASMDGVCQDVDIAVPASPEEEKCLFPRFVMKSGYERPEKIHLIHQLVVLVNRYHYKAL